MSRDLLTRQKFDFLVETNTPNGKPNAFITWDAYDYHSYGSIHKQAIENLWRLLIEERLAKP